MKIQSKWIILTHFILFLLPIQAFAYKIINDFTSPIGGTLSVSETSPPIITSCNMDPFGKYLHSDIAPIIAQGEALYSEAKAFLNSLSLTNTTDHRIRAIINTPDADYGTPGPNGGMSFIEEWETIYHPKYEAAIQKFLYGAMIGDENSIARLNDCVRSIATAYIVFGDEYFIDGMDYRIFPNIPDLNGQIYKRYLEIQSACGQYREGIEVFIDALSVVVPGTNDTYLADFFGQGEYDLFNMACDRLSSSMTEVASLEYLRNMAPDVKAEWPTAKAAFKGTVSDASIETYLQIAAISSRSNRILESGVKLLQYYDMLKNQGAIVLNNLNPLGYDNRFLPLANFNEQNGSLYPIAQQAVANATNSENAAKQDGREYDQHIEQLEAEISSLYGQYTAQLQNLTGVLSPVPAYPASEEYLQRIAQAGHDLLGCPIEADLTSFNACMSTKVTTGQLRSKYEQLKQADLKVEEAVKQRQQIKEQIDMEQSLNALQIQLASNAFTDRVMLLKDYSEKLIDAQKTSRNKVETTTREYDSKKNKWINKSKTVTTTRTIDFDARSQRIEVDKEIDLLRLEINKEIQITNAAHEVTIRKLLMELDNSLMHINSAVQEMNSISAEFFDLLNQKDTLLAMYLEAQKHMAYLEDKTMTSRITKSSSILKAREDLEVAKHWCYLTAKTLEYKFLYPITDLSIAGKKVSIENIFKAQTTTTLNDFLVGLNGLNSMWCGLGETFNGEVIVVSLMRDILGFPEDSTGQQRFKDFIKNHVNPTTNTLSFGFSTTPLDPIFYNPNDVLARVNVKDWHGQDPCGQFSAQGFAVNLKTGTQAGGITPRISMSHGGHITFLNNELDIQEYYPVKASSFIDDPLGGNDTPEVTLVSVTNPLINGTPLSSYSDVWVSGLKGRSIGASDWKVTISDGSSTKFDYSKLNDIELIFDTVGILVSR